MRQQIHALLLLSLLAGMLTLISPQPGHAQSGPFEDLERQLRVVVTEVLSELGGEVRLLALDFDGTTLTIDLSSAARSLADAGRFYEVMEPINIAVNRVFEHAQLGEERSLDYRFLIAGEPLSPTEKPLPVGDGANLALINGQRIVINPGHGWYYDGSTWRLQRGSWWGIVEDFINLELGMQLRDRLVNVGAEVRATRELNQAAGTHPSSGKPLWEVGAAAYTKHIGAPASVYAGSTSGINNDIMARPYFANWVGAAATISIHNNGGGGCGTETWYDTSNAYANQSRDLATRIQNKIIERVRAQWNANWCNRGVKGSNGGYGEIRAVNGPAVLIELAFMDTQSDNQALQNATFRSIVTQAISDAITEYFGGSNITCPVGTYRAEYFNNATLSGSPTFISCESSINTNWGEGGPGRGLNNDNFSVRWRGTHTFEGSTYAFVATADDGIRVSIDGVRIIDAWADQPATQYRATRGVKAGNHEILVEYYERLGGASAQLFWNVNLALKSPAYSYTVDRDWVASNGNDGNTSSRWSSRVSSTLGQEWWWTRIGNRQDITEVRVTWEAAYAANHCIAWWSDGDTMAQMYCYNITDSGRYVYPIGTRSAQYVGILMRKRAPLMNNYSFWEVGAYRWGGVLQGANPDEANGVILQPPARVEYAFVPTLGPTHTIYLPVVIR
ncbi:Galactose oxidase [Oscillochloris trichoides DG-6]|uniref:Galactose oxidase n=1 Tax=Oscillochloris trichoides DG-6 TaxID=765420 RepID=E1ICU4_9CHLR|nr:N-acetylmuramoyl-L-alanine amidase [Oscillochloris trichoides]EFO80999.1 Galactose oxidase [Oscillochloris trichoides DG-6]